jgi:hypothetical protein
MPAWSDDVFPSAKSLNMALYTSDGTLDNPTGIAFLAYRPLLLESYTPSGTFSASSGGSQSVLSTAAGTVASSLMVVDTAGYYGLTSDLPGKGYYQYTSVIAGSAGDGVTPGGWVVLSHVVPVKGTATQTSVSADLVPVGGSAASGSRQAPAGTAGAVAPFFCDLQNTGSSVWRPAVTIRDSSATTATLAANATDSSGQTPRFAAVWSAVSASTAGMAQFTVGGSYSWTAPQGVTQVTVAATGAGAGGGAGNVSPGGVEYGGGGGGGGEYASGTVAVTPGDNYPVTVGLAGTGGAEPGGNASAGGNSAFSGDAAPVTGHGGSLGQGASTSGNGTGGAGGTGAGGTHYDGGAGAAGATGSYGGGGGSSAGPAEAGNAASGAAPGGAAPAGGGPGGAGGAVTIVAVQQMNGTSTGNNSLKVTFSSPLQAGNTLVISAHVQGGSVTNPPTAILDDGTPLEAQVSDGDSPGGGAEPWQFAILTAFAVAGGEQSVTISGASGSNRAIMCRGWEFTGLGGSPNVDVTGNNGSGSSNTNKFSLSATGTGSPDLWFATVGSMCPPSEGSFSVNVNSGNGWTSPGQQTVSPGGIFTLQRAAWQAQASAGVRTYSGTMTASHHNRVLIAAFTAAAATTGAAPLTGPGGGGGAGLGPNNGGNGYDGQVVLTWTGQSGSGYGTPPLPAPYATWSASTRVGTAGDSGVDVDLNSSSGITNVVNFLSNPPVFKVSTTSQQSVNSATLTAYAATGGGQVVDNYGGGNFGTYTVQRAGLYLFHGLAAWTANSTGVRICGADVNGTTYWGPAYKATTAGTTNCTKTQIFSLQAGDTVQMALYQTSGGALTLASTDATRFFLTWLGKTGAPPVPWTPPDTTFRWASGTTGAALGTLFQAHVGNDLGFLSQPPYVLAYQTVAQSSLTVGAFSTVTLDTNAGIVHGDTGDNYGSWTAGASNLFTAPVAGWYLQVGEFFTASSSSAGARVTAAVQPSTSGGQSPSVAEDYFQVNVPTSTAAVGGGATTLGLSYCLAGETLTPLIRADSFASAYATLTGAAVGGQVNSHWELVWYSE